MNSCRSGFEPTLRCGCGAWDVAMVRWFRYRSCPDRSDVDTLAEWLRRRPAKPMESPRVGSYPTGVDFSWVRGAHAPHHAPLRATWPIQHPPIRLPQSGGARHVCQRRQTVPHDEKTDKAARRAQNVSRFHCAAISSAGHIWQPARRSTRSRADLNRDRWIQSPEC